MQLGANNLSTATIENTYRVLAVEKNNFVPIFMTNDIALMRISMGDDLKGSTPIIKFATHKERITGSCEIGGHGSPSFNAPLSEQFQVASINIAPMITCIMKLGYIVLPSISGSIICVGGGLTDTCQGDSGSGLICNGVLYGITSYG